jgi:hypothetical protein
MTLDEKIKLVKSKKFELIGSYPDGTLLRNDDFHLSVHILPHFDSITVKIVKYERIDSQLFRKEIMTTIDLFRSDNSFFFECVQGTFNNLRPTKV